MSYIHGLTFCQFCNAPIGGQTGPFLPTITPSPPPLPACEHCWCERVAFGGSYSRRGKYAQPHQQCCQCGRFRLAEGQTDGDLQPEHAGSAPANGLDV